MQPSLLEIIARGVLIVLINGLWQGAAIAGLTWLALRLFPRTNASTRYVAWTVALIATLIIPIVTSLPHISYVSQPATTVSASPDAHPGPALLRPRSHERASSAAQTQTANPSVPQIPRLHLSLNPAPIATAVFFGVWVLLALALVVRLALALTRLERLKSDAMPLGLEYRDRLVQWQRLYERDRDVRICVTDGIEVPVAVGLFDSMVLLPQHLLDEFDASEIDQISLHELAHLLRHDDWTNGLQRIIAALLFFNPAVWFIARQMDIEREVACDDYVLELTGAVRTYAFCLTKMAERTSWPHQPLAAPGVFTTRKNISIRIERLLRSGRAVSSKISPVTAVAVAIGLIAGYLLARSVTPAVAFAMPGPVPPVAPWPPVHETVTAKQIAQVEPVPTLSAAPPKPAATSRAWTRPAVVVTTKPLTVTVRATTFNVPATSVKLPQTSYTIPSVKVTMPHLRIAAVGDHPGMNCSGCDFENQNLAGKNFAGSDLTGSDFSHSNLQNANFDGANLSGVDFQGADLRNASFTGANLEGANLAGAKLDGANLDHANLSGSDIDVRSLSQAQIRAYLPRCSGCDLHGANLSGMDLRGIHLTGVDLSHADLRGANLQNAIFSGVDFSGADLRGANTDGTKFLGCDFSGAQLGNP